MVLARIRVQQWKNLQEVKKNNMLLYGASGHAKVIIDCLVSQGEVIHGIFDDYSDLVSLNGYDVYNDYDSKFEGEEKVIIAVGDNVSRKKIAAKVKHEFGRIWHTSSVISESSEIGQGTVIMHNAVVQPGARIGKHCIVNTGSSIDHDCRLGDFVHISPKVTLCGNVNVGEGVHIGAGATVIPNVTIGKWCIVGAGAVITQNLPDYSLVVGVPGKVIRKIEEGESL